MTVSGYRLVGGFSDLNVLLCFWRLGSVRLVTLYKGALCKEPLITPLKWAMGEEPFHSSPQVITIKPGYDIEVSEKH